MPETGGLFVIDGEDAGAGTPWEFSSITVDTNQTFALASDASAGHGDSTNGYKLTWDGADDVSTGYKDFATNLSEVYVRFYVNIATTVAVAQWATLYLFSLIGASSTTTLGQVRIDRSSAGTGAPQRWSILGQDLTALATVSTFAVDTWKRVDVHWIAGTGADGGFEVWIDDTALFSELNNNLTSYSAYKIIMGNVAAGSNPATGSIIYFDDIKAAATGPIGTYTAAATGGIDIPIVMAFYRGHRK